MSQLLFIPAVGPAPTYQQAFGSGANHNAAAELAEAQTMKAALLEKLTEADAQISVLDAAGQQDQQTLRGLLDQESGLRAEAKEMRKHQCSEKADNPAIDDYLLVQQYSGMLGQLSLISDTCEFLRNER